jgi:hypothetical protein
LFIKNANLLELEDVDDALQEAKDQGAFLLWNHPGWKAQQPDTTLWWDKHTQLLKKGLINGIEVYNNNEYYPEAFEWSIEKKLAVFCNTDVHGPINMSYDLSESHRPMTLVFAKEKSKKSIKEALFARRSVAFFENTLMGPAKYLDPLFFASIVIGPKSVQLTNKGISLMNITNNSDIDYELDLLQPSVGFTSPEKIFLKAHHTTRIELSGNSEEIDKFEKLYLYYSVANMYTAPDSNLIVTLSVNNF